MVLFVDYSLLRNLQSLAFQELPLATRTAKKPPINKTKQNKNEYYHFSQ